eukprot:scaffold7273_cov349-Ochromonas_danica.AAC.3
MRLLTDSCCHRPKIHHHLSSPSHSAVQSVDFTAGRTRKSTNCNAHEDEHQREASGDEIRDSLLPPAGWKTGQ